MAIENFTTYTEEDDNHKLIVTAPKALAVDVDRDEDVYLYKDKGVNHFDALDIDFEIYLDSASVDDSYGGMAIANTIGSGFAFANTDILVVINASDPVDRLRLARGYFVASDTYNCSKDTPYYCTLERAAGADTVYLKIYSDSGRTNLLATLEVAGFGTTKYRYVYGFVNLNSTDSGLDFDGYVQNLDLKIPGWTGKISGVTNPAKVMGVAVANIAKVKGVS